MTKNIDVGHLRFVIEQTENITCLYQFRVFVFVLCNGTYLFTGTKEFFKTETEAMQFINEFTV